MSEIRYFEKTSFSRLKLRTDNDNKKKQTKIKKKINEQKDFRRANELVNQNIWARKDEFRFGISNGGNRGDPKKIKPKTQTNIDGFSDSPIDIFRGGRRGLKMRVNVRDSGVDAVVYSAHLNRFNFKLLAKTFYFWFVVQSILIPG
jgi:hypothetical protein